MAARTSWSDRFSLGLHLSVPSRSENPSRGMGMFWNGKMGAFGAFAVFLFWLFLMGVWVGYKWKWPGGRWGCGLHQRRFELGFEREHFPNFFHASPAFLLPLALHLFGKENFEISAHLFRKRWYQILTFYGYF